MMMWGLDPATKIWLSTNRFGEIGGTNLGFFGALWGYEAKTILAHGWGGSFHVWHQEDESSLWRSRLSISGHYGSVTSLAWEPEGKYFISVSSDQTARLHGCWKREGSATWHELARPQIHGYDMEDVAFLSRLRYISGSEEKIVRVFDAPGSFIESMVRLGVDENLQDDVSGMLSACCNMIVINVLCQGQRPKAAAVPALGLSNKAVFESGLIGSAPDGSHVSTSLLKLRFQIPNRSRRSQNLGVCPLWKNSCSPPRFGQSELTHYGNEAGHITDCLLRTEKLYGHGYEINAIAASHDGRFIASACRSTTSEHAVIRLHHTSNWSQVKPPLTGHSLTVTSIRFSLDDRYILSCSRDRSWQLYERTDDGQTYTRRAAAPKAHARIIWDCAWAKDGSFFATAARDKQVKIWQNSDSDAASWKPVATLSLPDAGTAVDITRHGDL